MVKSPPSNAGDAGSVPGELGSMCHGAAKLECCGGSLWATTKEKPALRNGKPARLNEDLAQPI